MSMKKYNENNEYDMIFYWKYSEKENDHIEGHWRKMTNETMKTNEIIMKIVFECKSEEMMILVLW